METKEKNVMFVGFLLALSFFGAMAAVTSAVRVVLRGDEDLIGFVVFIVGACVSLLAGVVAREDWARRDENWRRQKTTGVVILVLSSVACAVFIALQ